MARVERATQDDAPATLRLRTSAEEWLAQRRIVQWAKGEVTLTAIQEHVARDEWHVARDGWAVTGALRLLWSDAPVWQADDAFAAYVHGLVIDRRLAGSGLGASLLAWQGNKAVYRVPPFCASTASRATLAFVAATPSAASEGREARVRRPVVRRCAAGDAALIAALRHSPRTSSQPES